MDTTERVFRWEAQREVKNLMGRYTRALLHKEEGAVPDRFWSRREDVSLGLNEGWYRGQDSVRGYYGWFEQKTECTDGIMKQLFPQIPAEHRGIGYLEMKSLSSDLVEIAGDGQSARGMWNCAGQKVDYTPAGPVTFLTYGTYFVDFVREDGQFRILNMQYLEEICHPQGQKWWEAPKVLPEMAEFALLKEMTPPEPDIPQQLWERYRTDRPMPELPPAPEPYETLGDTFSYGISQEVWL